MVAKAKWATHPAIDNVGGCGVVIPYAHHEIHDGDMFDCSFVTNLSNGAIKKFLVRPPSSTKKAHFFIVAQSQAEMEMRIYETPEIAASGTSATTFNRDRNATNSAETMVREDPTVSGSSGLQLRIERWGSGKSAGGASRDEGERILKTSGGYLVWFQNGTSSDNQLNVILDWYEHTDVR